jgi:hypothetical protein
VKFWVVTGDCAACNNPKIHPLFRFFIGSIRDFDSSFFVKCRIGHLRSSVIDPNERAFSKGVLGWANLREK